MFLFPSFGSFGRPRPPLRNPGPPGFPLLRFASSLIPFSNFTIDYQVPLFLEFFLATPTKNLLKSSGSCSDHTSRPPLFLSPKSFRSPLNFLSPQGHLSPAFCYQRPLMDSFPLTCEGPEAPFHSALRPPFQSAFPLPALDRIPHD